MLCSRPNEPTRAPVEKYQEDCVCEFIQILKNEYFHDTRPFCARVEANI